MLSVTIEMNDFEQAKLSVCKWMARLSENGESAECVEEFQRWLHESPMHMEGFLRVLELWQIITGGLECIARHNPDFIAAGMRDR